MEAPTRRSILGLGLGSLLGAALTRDADAKPAADLDLSTVRADGGRVRVDAGGGTVGLTLDPSLQRSVDALLDASRAPAGAVAVSDVRNGRLLAWATRGAEGDLVRRAKYPGASLFKIVTAAALLEKRAVEPGQTVCFGGGESRLREEDVRPGCHPGDSRVRFDQALGRSINGVFGRAALAHLSQAELLAMADALGVGQAPPLDLPADRTSIVIPSGGLGLARAAAGFGEARMSVLGALAMMQTLANDGERVRLHVVGPPDGVPRVTMGPAMSKRTADALTRMLEKTVKVGTSAHAFRPLPGKPRLAAAGKTGTLLVERPSRRLVSWFAGFAPSHAPEVAVSVLLANDEKWWRKANELARDVLDAYFEKRGRRVAKRR